MSLFVDVIFWAFFGITTIGFTLFVIYSWAGGVGDSDFAKWIKTVNMPDPTNIKKRDGNIFYRWAEIFGLLMATGVTFGGIVWVAGGLQIASWIYNWGL